eukprot:6491564-Amphidinium_carterae.3
MLMHQRQALALFTNPSWHDILVLLMQSLEPERIFMGELLHMTSSAFEYEQCDRLTRGCTRRWRVLDLHFQMMSYSFLQLVSVAMHEPDLCTRFRIAIRSPAVVHQLIVAATRGFPYQLYTLVVDRSLENCERLLSAPRCLLDLGSQKLLQRYESAHALQRDSDLVETLRAAAYTIACSIYSTERTHSSNARRKRAVVSTHVPHVTQLALPHAAVAGPLWLRDLVHLEQLRLENEHPILETQASGTKRQHDVQAQGHSKRSRGGGAWRALVHHQCAHLGAKFDTRALSQMYWQMSPDERAFYERLGHEGTYRGLFVYTTIPNRSLCTYQAHLIPTAFALNCSLFLFGQGSPLLHQTGSALHRMGSGFASMSKRMREQRTKQKTRLCTITSEMQAHGRALCNHRKACIAQERNNMKSLLGQSNVVIDSILHDRRGLAAISGCKWYGLPHTCRHMCANLLARHAQTTTHGASGSGLTKKALSDAWQARHSTVLPSPKSRVKGATSACFREGFCHCKPRHRGLRALRDCILKILKVESRDKLARQGLAAGQFGLAFFSEHTERECIFAHISLQYFKPFRPTFALLSHFPDRCAANSGAVRELLCAGHGVFSLKLQREEKAQHTDLPCLRTLVELCSELAAHSQWSCCLFELSDRDSPCALPPAAIRVWLKGSIHQLWSEAKADEDEAFLDILLHGVSAQEPRVAVEAHESEDDKEDEEDYDDGIDETEADFTKKEAEHTGSQNGGNEDNANSHEEFVA